MPMSTVQALNAVCRTHAELHNVRLFARRTEAARHTIRAVATRRTHVTLRMCCIYCTTRHASHTLQARGTRPAVVHLIELIRIVAHQALRQRRRWCRATGTQIAHTVDTSVSGWAYCALRVHRIRLLAIRTRLTHNAIRRVPADRHAISHIVHTWLASTVAACSSERTWLAAGVIAIRPSPVSTHVTVHEIRCVAPVRLASRVHSVSTRFTRHTCRTETTRRAQVARCAVNARCSTRPTLFTSATDASLPSTAQYTRGRLAQVVDLLSVQTGAACTITARMSDVALLTARALSIRLRARRTHRTHTSSPSIACATWLTLPLICRRLSPRCTLAARSALASPSRRTRLARCHVLVRLSAICAHSTSAVRSREASSTACA